MAAKDSEQNLVLVPHAFWHRFLQPKLEKLLDKKLPPNKSFKADETNVVVSVTDRSERDLVNRFDELDIEWPILEKQLQAWNVVQLHRDQPIAEHNNAAGHQTRIFVYLSPLGGVYIFWLFVYSLTIGSLAYSIISETSSVRLQPLSVMLTRTAYQRTTVLSQALVVFVWVYFRLPEIKCRIDEELNILFANKTRARAFAKAHVDTYALLAPVEAHTNIIESE
ncbi:hypothetical protein N657DRAFT_634331 [Parathielavia appendiculata]|uniref:Uncharacterized protein n=1 Tax=Parathielavia appendiculata TaxID=2587402 RepID=A0AAN6TYL9_9PEZI|nr:hypothetical protein N657DRAFT_634331 [Parathielavia appendiculata]